jgi:hypothetical protein
MDTAAGVGWDYYLMTRESTTRRSIHSPVQVCDERRSITASTCPRVVLGKSPYMYHPTSGRRRRP